MIVMGVPADSICSKCGCVRGVHEGWWKHPSGMCERAGMGCSHRCNHDCEHET